MRRTPPPAGLSTIVVLVFLANRRLPAHTALALGPQHSGNSSSDRLLRLIRTRPRPCKMPPALFDTGVLLARRTDDGLAAGRLLQHRRQRPRAALRLLGGDARVLGLHQGAGQRPLHAPAPLPRAQGRRPMVGLYGFHTGNCSVIIFAWRGVVTCGQLHCRGGSFVKAYYGNLRVV